MLRGRGRGISPAVRQHQCFIHGFGASVCERAHLRTYARTHTHGRARARVHTNTHTHTHLGDGGRAARRAGPPGRRLGRLPGGPRRVTHAHTHTHTFDHFRPLLQTPNRRLGRLPGRAGFESNTHTHTHTHTRLTVFGQTGYPFAISHGI